jgi:hypothetical protein
MSTDAEIIASLKSTTRRLRDTRLQIQNTHQTERDRISGSIRTKLIGGVGGMGINLNRSKRLVEHLEAIIEVTGCDRALIMEFHGELKDPTITEVPFRYYSCTHEVMAPNSKAMPCWKHYQKCSIVQDELAIKKMVSDKRDLYIPEIHEGQESELFSQLTFDKFVFEGSKSTYFYGLRILTMDHTCTLGFIKFDFTKKFHNLKKNCRTNLLIMELVEQCAYATFGLTLTEN